MNNHKHVGLLGLTAAIAVKLTAASAVFADAWGASWGSLEGGIVAGPDDSVVWNADPALWGLWAEGEVFHMCPPLTHDYAIDLEVGDPLGDGLALMGGVATGDLARVQQALAAVASADFSALARTAPRVDLSGYHNVYSYAHNIPNSWSEAAGFGQHDNAFWVDYQGGGDPPAATRITLQLGGEWYLEGDSEPDDYWWADARAYLEIYAADTGDVLASAEDYRFIEGPGYNADSGSYAMQFELEVAYGTAYAMRFWLDLETYAIAVPHPSAASVLACGGWLTLRGRRRRVTA